MECQNQTFDLANIKSNYFDLCDNPELPAYRTLCASAGTAFSRIPIASSTLLGFSLAALALLLAAAWLTYIVTQATPSAATCEDARFDAKSDHL